MHAAAYAFVERTVKQFGSGEFVVEIGARDINGSVRRLFETARYLTTDIAPGPGVDLVADGATYEPGVAPDRVVCCEVLEHTPAAPAIVVNALRIVRPGGIVIPTAAGPGRAPHNAHDGGPVPAGEYYRNVDPSQLRDWLRAADPSVVSVESNTETHDVYAWARK